MSDTMRTNALIGLSLALVAIFIYLSFRFEYEFATAALLCLVHDVLITIGAIGLLHVLKVPVQIDLHTIAALMTIIGYSLNDTIIIFDRIREEIEKGKKIPFIALVNQALNHTLSRTVMTSGTTLLVLCALVLFGGASLFSFSLIMLIGILFGTFSSWFIAAPILVFLNRKQMNTLENVT
jgi:SecD/SecF fusion protein